MANECDDVDVSDEETAAGVIFADTLRGLSVLRTYLVDSLTGQVQRCAENCQELL